MPDNATLAVRTMSFSLLEWSGYRTSKYARCLKLDVEQSSQCLTCTIPDKLELCRSPKTSEYAHEQVRGIEVTWRANALIDR